MRATVALVPAVAEEERMSGRRLIGIDLAWKDGNCSGCVELVADGDRLTLTRVRLICEIDDIVKWIDPERGEWIVAIDAPLVVRNRDKSREAERQVNRCYTTRHASARPASHKSLGKNHRGGQLLRALTEKHCGDLIEEPHKLIGPRLVFETYPHPATIELFGRGCIVKYKNVSVVEQRDGQEELVKEIRRHLASGRGTPQLCRNGALKRLLRKPNPPLEGDELKAREDRLDALLCAYIAAWAGAGRPMKGFGALGKGVIMVPQGSPTDDGE